jgi:Transposase DDE domain group 1
VEVPQAARAEGSGGWGGRAGGAVRSGPGGSAVIFSPAATTAAACSRPGGSSEPLAVMLRPGNAGSNTAADHIAAAKLALAQLPKGARRRVLIRSDSGGGTHEFLNWLTRPGRRLAYSVGFNITDDIAAAILAISARRGRRLTTPATRSGTARGSPSSAGCSP